jgi:hypothetical protein
MSDDALIDCVQTISREASGVLSLHIVYPEDTLDLLVKALNCDVDAMRLMSLVPNVTKGIRKAPRRAPGKCGCCGTPIRSRFALAVVLPECDDPTQGLTIELCRKCTADRQNVPNEAAQAMQDVWPDGRLVTITHSAAGRA